jgi:hypothetical protein
MKETELTPEEAEEYFDKLLEEHLAAVIESTDIGFLLDIAKQSIKAELENLSLEELEAKVKDFEDDRKEEFEEMTKIIEKIRKN